MFFRVVYGCFCWQSTGGCCKNNFKQQFKDKSFSLGKQGRRRCLAAGVLDIWHGTNPPDLGTAWHGTSLGKDFIHIAMSNLRVSTVRVSGQKTADRPNK